MKLLVRVIQYLLGTTLLYGGLGEIRHPFVFLSAVNAYELTGPVTGVVVAAVLPWLEAVVGTCLLAGVLTEGAFLGAVLLNSVFFFAICSAWHRELGIGCGCFGGDGSVIGLVTVLRSAFLLAAAGAGLAMARRVGSTGPRGDRQGRSAEIPAFVVSGPFPASEFSAE
jgi:hypothetical protein